MKKVLVVLGPTATGKTDMALRLAKKFNGQLVACDSRQIYKGLDIGTGKLPTAQVTVDKHNGYWLIDGVKVWMYDVIGLDKQYTVADYVRDATKIISEIHAKGKLPIIVGGTGLYLKALIDKLPNLEIPVDQNLREQLQKLNLIQLQQELKKLSFPRWSQLNNSDRQNPRRLLRSIELSMYPYKGKYQISNTKFRKWDTLKIGLTAPREILYKNSDLRIFNWIKNGIIDEVKNLIISGVPTERFLQLGLEYKIIANYLGGWIKEDKLITKIQYNLHSYIRRQQTWFKKVEKVNWFNIMDLENVDKIEKLISKWYDLATYAKED